MTPPSLNNILASLESVPDSEWIPSKHYVLSKITGSHHTTTVEHKRDGSRRLYRIDVRVAKTPWVEIP